MLDNSNTRKVFVKQMEINEFQTWMSDIYKECDAERGIPATVAWLTEELGELAQAVRKGTREQQIHEIGDVLAWLTSLANQLDIDLSEAAKRFAQGCPRCGETPCGCSPPSAEVNVVAPRGDRRSLREELDEIAEELAEFMHERLYENALLQFKGSYDDYEFIVWHIASHAGNIRMRLNELNGLDEKTPPEHFVQEASDDATGAKSFAEGLLRITGNWDMRRRQTRHWDSDEEQLARITHVTAQLLVDSSYLFDRWRGSKP